MKKKKTKEYTDEQLGYFQYMNDKDEFMVDDVQDMDYIDHLMGGVANPYDGLDMDTSFEDLDESSDWFMDQDLGLGHIDVHEKSPIKKIHQSSSGDVKVGFESRTLES